MNSRNSNLQIMRDIRECRATIGKSKHFVTSRISGVKKFDFCTTDGKDYK